MSAAPEPPTISARPTGNRADNAVLTGGRTRRWGSLLLGCFGAASVPADEMADASDVRGTVTAPAAPGANCSSSALPYGVAGGRQSGGNTNDGESGTTEKIGANAECVWDVDNTPGTVRLRRQPVGSLGDSREILEASHTFDAVCGPGDTTRSLYTSQVRPLVRSTLLEGYDALVLCIGARGSGRTRTMTGTCDDPGTVPLAVTDLFRFWRRDMSAKCGTSKSKRSRGLHWRYTRCRIRVSYLEVRGEEVRDLLAGTEDGATLVDHVPGTGLAAGTAAGDYAASCHERDTSVGVRRVVPTEAEAFSAEKVFRILARGTEVRRRLASTTGGAGCRAGVSVDGVNSSDPLEGEFGGRGASASHSIVRLIVERRAGPEARRTAALTLVDLGGSADDDAGLQDLEELVRKISSSSADFDSSSKRPDDPNEQSLFATTEPTADADDSNLDRTSRSPTNVMEFVDDDKDGNMCHALSRRGRTERHDSALVRLLHPALSHLGPSHVCVVCALSASRTDADAENMSSVARSLDFARRAKAVPLWPVPVDVVYDEPPELREARDEIAALTAQLGVAEREARTLRKSRDDERIDRQVEATRLRRELGQERRTNAHSMNGKCSSASASVDGAEDFATTATAECSDSRLPAARSLSASFSFHGGADVPGGIDGLSCLEESGLRDAVRYLDRVIRQVASPSSALRRRHRKAVVESGTKEAPVAVTDGNLGGMGERSACAPGAVVDDEGSSASSWAAVGATGALMLDDEDAENDYDGEGSVVSSVSSGSYRTALQSRATVSFHQSLSSTIGGGGVSNDNQGGVGTSFRTAREDAGIGNCDGDSTANENFGKTVELKGGHDSASPDNVVSWEACRSHRPPSLSRGNGCRGGAVNASFEFDDARSALSSLTGTTMIPRKDGAAATAPDPDPSAVVGELYRIQRMLCSALEKEERRRRHQHQEWRPPPSERSRKDGGNDGNKDSVPDRQGLESSSMRGVATRSEIISRLLEASEEKKP